MSNKKVIAGMLLIITLIFSGCSTMTQNNNTNNDNDHELQEGQKPTQENTQKPHMEADPVEEQVKSMTLEEKVGQMVLIGLDGYVMDDNTRNMIENNLVGGFILFGRNVKNANQLLDLVNSLKSTNSANRVPLFVSVDEEGGRITRMPMELKKLPSNKTIGKVNNAEFSFEIGSVLAEEIKAFGFNMDFAPVLDISSSPRNPVIGDRSYGSYAEIVSKLGIQTMKGISMGGVIPVVKHFPGHGDTTVDSHIGLPSVNNDMERLKSFELVPFKDAIDNQADAVMIAHILMNKIDPQSPASLSKAVITELLRNQLNFDGVVITDDMTMGAITKNYNIGDAAVKSVKAGSDIVLVCHGYDNGLAVINALKNAIQNGSIPEETVNKSVYRILKVKRKYNLTDNVINSIAVEKINSRINAVLGRYLNNK